MSDIINLLPDSVANQIAAGEVIQRPASVVKELVENAVDAGATDIKVVIKDGGNTLIQVIDNGKGMSETDARMSFERHATSKIKNANDLFALHTKGFRGEALASIAAVAQVEMRTKLANEDLGTFIEIAGTRVFRQESIQHETGTNISVKNLFFNVPARRRFLKAQSTEMMHIRNEFYRIVLVHPAISFSLIDNTTTLLQLPETTLKGRIEHVFGLARKKMEQQLLPIHIETDFMSISGFVARPEYAQKNSNQYFFVNDRYMRHPYFHKAVLNAYDKLLKQGDNPNYFIYFTIHTDLIDVNIHPSKTEIKFENEQPIWSMLHATVKEVLGKFQIAPSIDFNTEDKLEIPTLDASVTIRPPQTNFDPDYNPFKTTSSYPKNKKPAFDWEQLYEDFSKNKIKNTEESGFDSIEIEPKIEEEQESEQMKLAVDESNDIDELFQLKKKYICTNVKSGLLLIDQFRSHFRILYERYFYQLQHKNGISQTLLFPEIFELTPNLHSVLTSISDDLHDVGFRIESVDKNEFSLVGIPSEIDVSNAVPLLNDLIFQINEMESTVKEIVHEKIATLMAKQTAIHHGQTLTRQEMKNLIDELFSCKNHSYTPDGKLIMIVVENNELERRFG